MIYLSKKEQINEHAKKIMSGKIPDDYTNHFLSHFGFHDFDTAKETNINLEIHKDIYKK